MKIIHIANFYGPKSGGIKTTLHNLGSGYTNRGHDFTYIVPGVGWYLTFIVVFALVCCVCVYFEISSYPLFLNLICSSRNCS